MIKATKKPSIISDVLVEVIFMIGKVDKHLILLLLALVEFRKQYS